MQNAEFRMTVEVVVKAIEKRCVWGFDAGHPAEKLFSCGQGALLTRSRSTHYGGRMGRLRGLRPGGFDTVSSGAHHLSAPSTEAGSIENSEVANKPLSARRSPLPPGEGLGGEAGVSRTMVRAAERHRPAGRCVHCK